MKLLLIILLLFSSTAQEQEVSPVSIIDRTIRHTSNALSKSYSKRVARAVYKASRKWKVDWKVLVAILYQESSYRADPGSCNYPKKSCSDVGIAQINYDTWKDKLSLNKKKLVNLEYNIDNAAHILSFFKDKKDKKWYSKFHSLTPMRRKIYVSYVEPKIKTINRFVNQQYYTSQ